MEGCYGDGDDWFKCEIKNVRRNGTYDLRYDDGDEETNVKEERIRPVNVLEESATDEVEKPSEDFDIGMYVVCMYVCMYVCIIMRREIFAYLLTTLCIYGFHCSRVVPIVLYDSFSTSRLKTLLLHTNRSFTDITHRSFWNAEC